MTGQRHPPDPTAPLNAPGRVGTDQPSVTGSELPADVCAMLREARERRGWSIRRAAREMHTAHSMVLRMERGERAPSVAMAELLIDAYQLGPIVAERLLEVARPGVGRSSPWRAHRAAYAPAWRAQ